MITVHIPESNSKKQAIDSLVEQILKELKQYNECRFNRHYSTCQFSSHNPKSSYPYQEGPELGLPEIEFKEVISTFRNKGYYVYIDNNYRNPYFSSILIK